MEMKVMEVSDGKRGDRERVRRSRGAIREDQNVFPRVFK